jgi:hypothetical protein
MYVMICYHNEIRRESLAVTSCSHLDFVTDQLYKLFNSKHSIVWAGQIRFLVVAE